MTLSEIIEVAFADVQYPGDDHITDCPCDECVEIAEYFRGKTPRGHSVDELWCHATALVFFTVDAYRYFLPAFLFVTIENFDVVTLTTSIPDDIVRSLTPSSYRPSLDDMAYKRRGSLSPGQFSAVKQFLEWLRSFRPDDGELYSLLYYLARPIPVSDAELRP